MAGSRGRISSASIPLDHDSRKSDPSPRLRDRASRGERWRKGATCRRPPRRHSYRRPMMFVLPHSGHCVILPNGGTSTRPHVASPAGASKPHRRQRDVTVSTVVIAGGRSPSVLITVPHVPWPPTNRFSRPVGATGPERSYTPIVHRSGRFESPFDRHSVLSSGPTQLLPLALPVNVWQVKSTTPHRMYRV